MEGQVIDAVVIRGSLGRQRTLVESGALGVRIAFRGRTV